MGQEVVLPGTFKGPAKAFAALAGQTESLSVGIGQSYAVLGYKGKVWSLRYRGERKAFVRLDDGTPANYLDVIILGQAKSKSKSFFQKYDPNSGDGGDRPLCSSIDGIMPDADVTAPQSSTCALCPRNVWKTDPQTGRRGRECQDYKRLAVMVLPPQTKAILGQALMEPVFLRVPPASLNSLSIMGDALEKQGYPFFSVIVRITFDPNKSWPEMVFRPIQELTDAEAPVILEMMGDPLVERITVGDPTRRNNGEEGSTVQVIPPQQAQPPQPQAGVPLSPLPSASGLATQPQPAPQPPPPAFSTTAAPEAAPPPTLQSVASAPPVTTLGGQQTSPVSTGLNAPPAASPLPTANASPPSSPDTGILSGGANGVIPAPQPSDGVIPDAGVAGETDADLDARIASVLAKKA